MTAPPPAPVRTRREQAVEEIRRLIILGELTPGQRLREVALATELGVSRPTLREALRTLTHEGLCEQQPHRGFRVAELEPAAIRDLTETRLLLDRLAAQGIAGNTERLAVLDAAWTAYSRAASDDDPLAQHRAHVEFHRALWAAADNDTLNRLWPTIESLSTLVLAQDQALRADPARALSMHGEIVAAIAGGDPQAIDAALDSHTRQSAEEFISRSGR